MYLAPGVPWYAKLLAACVVGYAFSPIDLIPDFIPVIGHLDDLIIVPLGIYLAIGMIPKPIWEECLEQAAKALSQDRPRNWVAAVVVVAVWVVILVIISVLINKAISK
ncbi:MAG: DUF1232 domain-containing protein [candidate division Zixibacteria bacterium]|nr:DUF1232 domain-containing protein [candidate division Zixibacteria bacterium]